MANEMIAPVQDQLLDLQRQLPGTVASAVTSAVTAAVTLALKQQRRRQEGASPEGLGEGSPLTRWDAFSYAAGVTTVASLLGLAKLLGWF